MALMGFGRSIAGTSRMAFLRMDTPGEIRLGNPFGWEHIAPWIGGPYFPPVGGEEMWSRMARKLRANGNPLFLLLSGARWGVRMDNAGYNDRDRFLRETAPVAAAYDAAGKPMEEQPPRNTYLILF